MTAASPRHEMEMHVRLGAMRDGTIRAIDLHTLSNTGAYGEHGPTTVGLSGHKEFERLVRQVNKYPEFTLTGETFKRPKKAPSALLEPWYNRKGGFSLQCVRSHDDLLFSPDLVPYLLEEWEKLTPMYRYLSTVDGDPDPRDPLE